MNIQSLVKNAKFSKLKARAAAGTTDQTPAAAVDMAGFDSVAFIFSTGDGTSGTVLELQVYKVATDAVTGGTEVTTDDVTYTSTSATDADNKLMIADVCRWDGNYRYAYCTAVIDTQNCESDGLYAIQYNAKDVPVTQPASVLDSAAIVDG